MLNKQKQSKKQATKHEKEHSVVSEMFLALEKMLIPEGRRVCIFYFFPKKVFLRSTVYYLYFFQYNAKASVGISLFTKESSKLNAC